MNIERGAYVQSPNNGIMMTVWVLTATGGADGQQEQTHTFRTQEQAEGWAETHYDSWIWHVDIYQMEVPDPTMSHFRLDEEV